MPDDKERREEGPEGGPEERLHEFIRERFPGRKRPWEEATEPEVGSDSDDEEEPNGEDEEHRTSNEEPDRADDEA